MRVLILIAGFLIAFAAGFTVHTFFPDKPFWNAGLQLGIGMVFVYWAGRASKK
ncbi:MAG: hypothetical protein QT00_C0001G0509 [archaeon GW2011_AR5]|nr:MAG: hypothetical protein QT00_C0001G0509 [archaeon GW2011_AR5]